MVTNRFEGFFERDDDADDETTRHIQAVLVSMLGSLSYLHKVTDYVLGRIAEYDDDDDDEEETGGNDAA